MSLRAMLWALYDAQAGIEETLGPEFRVLMSLADHASDDGTGAFPWPATIAEDLVLSIRTVYRHLAKLERL